MSTDFHSLPIKKIIRETENSISVYFDVSETLAEQYSFEPGQYLTLKFDKNGEEYRRAYSICTSPLSGDLAVTSKRVPNGVISNHMNDHLAEGQTVEVMQPQGTFTVDLNHDRMADYYLFAGGSGITPMMSLIKTIVEQEPKSVVHLYYGNRDEANIIFKDELESLLTTYAGQLTVRHILSDPVKKKSGFFSKAKSTWHGWSGFPNQDNIGKFLQENPQQGKEQVYMICGPTMMMDVVKQSLESLGVAADQIKIEYFASPKKEEAGQSAAATGDGKQIKVKLKGEELTVAVPAGKTILDALLDLKKDAPYSCTSGACSTCVAKVTQGKVEMDACYALDDDEVESGYILTCQAHPTTDDVEILFED